MGRDLVSVCVLLVAVVVSSCTSQDDQRSYDPHNLDLPPSAERELSKDVAVHKKQWQPPKAKQADDTLRYLKSDEGRMVRDATERIRNADEAMGGFGSAGGCQGFARQWDKDFPPRAMVTNVGRLRDPALVDAFSEQFDAIVAMVEACRTGKVDDARKFARIARAWYGVYHQRLTQLEHPR